MKVSALKRAVLITLGYTHHFSFPLTARELFVRLILPHEKEKITPTLFAAALYALRIEGHIIQSGEYFSLSRMLANQAEEIRTRRKKESERKIRELMPLLEWMTILPWVVAVGVTGSVAVGSAEEADDTDIFIVVEPGSLWLTRPLLVGLSLWYKKRRTWHSEEPRSWCLNLWLESSHLALPPSRWSVYSAYEVCQIKWLIDKNGICKSFLTKNRWVSYYLPQYFAVCMLQCSAHQRNRITTILLYFLRVWTIPLNALAFIAQWWYMLPHMTREKVSYNTAFFHPRNTGYLLTERWRDSLQKYISI